MKRLFWSLAIVLCLALAATAQNGKRVIEQIVARVNNEVITLSDFARARDALVAEVDDDCRQRGCPRTEREEMVKSREKNLLSDMINQSLLVQRAKDVGINVQSQLIKEMDKRRQEYGFKDLEELCKAVEASGVACEDWQNNMRNSMMTQALIQREVRPQISNEEVRDYYEKNKEKFNRPERVYLSEILVSTEGKPESEIPALEQKANNLHRRLENGEEFSELAKRYSDGLTAADGGFLGGEGFARENLAAELSDKVFKLDRGQITEVVRTKTGFLILRVDQRFEAGLQPLEKVENEVMGALWNQKMRPALADYLKQLRADSYIQVKPGYTDTEGGTTMEIKEVIPEPEAEKDKKKRKKILWIF